jgi:tRNA dimethylallyltransferase
MPRDQKRLVRALEVYLVSGRTLTDHFAATVSPIADFEVFTIGLTLDRAALRDRVARRVDAQLAAGVIEEVRRQAAALVREGSRGALDRGAR